jgi:uncharacterized repeat protein (TIGR03803 family)
MQASDGMLYGMTSQGGANNLGVLFKYAGVAAGIEQYANGSAVNIYPNPSNGSFVIEIPSLTLPQGKGTLVQVYDVNGKMVLTQTINPETSSGQAGKTIIDASSLNEGVYNISLQSSGGVLNKRLVIVR